MGRDVFISHASEDQEAALAACGALEHAGLRCWIAPRDVPPGALWAAAITEAATESRVLLLVLSRHSAASEHVLRELAIAAAAGARILVLRTEAVEPSPELAYYVGRSQWLDLFRGSLRVGLGPLPSAVRALLEAPEGTDPRPPLAALGGPPRAARRRRVAALGLLALAAAAAALVLWPRRAATLVLETEPAAAGAWVDGVPLGASPLSAEVEAGRRALVVRLPGFRDWSRVVVLAPGERSSWSLQLVVADPRDASAVNQLARADGVVLPTYPLPQVERAAPEGAPLELVVPRGDVRPDDLSLLLLDADPRRVDPSGAIGLRRGDEVLFERPFAPTTREVELEVPAEVRSRVRPGDVLTWGWWPVGAPAVTLDVRVAADDLAPRREAIERRLAPQDPRVRAHVVAQLFFDRGLRTAAFLAARRLARGDPTDLRALALMGSALRGASAEPLRTVAAIEDRILAAPEGARAGVFAPAAPAR